MKLTDLKPAPYNPRTVTPEALAALQTSLVEFGDISGFTWNKRSGHLVSGHQRLEALRQKHGAKLKLTGGAIVTPEGERFPVRVVDWPVEREKAANLAANSPFLAGSFDPGGLEAVLTDLNAAEGLGTLLADLRLGELQPSAGDLLSVGEAEDADLPLTGDDVPDGNTEWIAFSTPLSAAQHQTVMRAVRLARDNGSDKIGDALYAIASFYIEEHSNG